MKSTLFYDMRSKGGRKLGVDAVLILARESIARVVFEKRFERNPDHVSCACCGADFEVREIADEEIAGWITNGGIRSLTVVHRGDIAPSILSGTHDAEEEAP
jgi:hypothetical protein